MPGAPHLADYTHGGHGQPFDDPHPPRVRAQMAVDRPPAVPVLHGHVPAAGARATGVGHLSLARRDHPRAWRSHQVDAAMQLAVSLQPADPELRRDLLEAPD